MKHVPGERSRCFEGPGGGVQLLQAPSRPLERRTSQSLWCGRQPIAFTLFPGDVWLLAGGQSSRVVIAA